MEPVAQFNVENVIADFLYHASMYECNCHVYGRCAFVFIAPRSKRSSVVGGRFTHITPSAVNWKCNRLVRYCHRHLTRRRKKNRDEITDNFHGRSIRNQDSCNSCHSFCKIRHVALILYQSDNALVKQYTNN